jgi:hypothetical protein
MEEPRHWRRKVLQTVEYPTCISWQILSQPHNLIEEIRGFPSNIFAPLELNRYSVIRPELSLFALREKLFGAEGNLGKIKKPLEVGTNIST